MTSRLAVIPARGASKRIKDKNIKNFFGKPIIYYIIEAAKESNLFDKIHVSTDSKVIKEIINKNDLTIDFMRPKYLSDDSTPLMPVLSYVVNKYDSMNLYYDEVWLLMACSPLIVSEDLIEASNLFSSQKSVLKPLLAVTEYAVPIEWAFSMDKSGELYPRFKGKFEKRSQDLPKSFFDSGNFAIFPRKNIIESNGEGTDSGFIGYKLPKKKAIDIDTDEDWKLAEAIYSYEFKEVKD